MGDDADDDGDMLVECVAIGVDTRRVLDKLMLNGEVSIASVDDVSDKTGSRRVMFGPVMERTFVAVEGGTECNRPPICPAPAGVGLVLILLITPLPLVRLRLRVVQKDAMARLEVCQR